MDYYKMINFLSDIGLISKKGLISKLSAYYESAKPDHSSWDVWDISVHKTEGQPGRMQRALTQNYQLIEKKAGVCFVVGSKGAHYRTCFDRCECKDFEKRGLPCKHMYTLAMKKAGFDPVPFIIKTDIIADPVRGFMNLGMYKVKGKNPATNRLNTKTIYASDEESAVSAGRLAGLVDPFTVSEVEMIPPTSDSLDVAAKQGVYIPEGAKETDVLASIRRYNDWNEVTITKRQWKYAASLGVPISALAGDTYSREEFQKNNKRWLSDEKLVSKYGAELQNL